MSDRPVNLNRVRKEKARKDAKAKADANAAKFGRTRAERDVDTAREVAARRRLDQHKRDPE